MFALTSNRPSVSRALCVMLASFLLAGCGINTIPTFRNRCQSRLERGAKSIQAPRRPDSQSGRDGKGLCHAGEGRS